MLQNNKTWEEQLPPAELEVSEHHLLEFFRTMYERQEIWYKRVYLGLPKPWTTEPVFKEYKFCNVYRETDRSSQWLIKNILLKDKNIEDILFRMMVYRIYNLPETFKNIEIPTYAKYNKDKFTKEIVAFANAGNNPLNTKAYLINTFFQKGKSYEIYSEHIIPSIHNIIPEIVELLDFKRHDIKNLIALFKTVTAIGGFVSHEWFLDQCYLNKYTDIKFPYDENSYTNIGPGCTVGVRLVFPSLKGNAQQKKGLEVLRDIAPEWLASFGKFKYLYWNKGIKQYYVDINKPNLCISNMEFFTCEYQKYFKIIVKSGKQRGKFIPKS